MKIDDISITRSVVVNSGGRFHLKAEVGGLKFDGFFDDFGGFLTAVRDFGAFIAVRHGKMTAAQGNSLTSRNMAPGARAQ
jgi:hypothetical protein